MGTQGDAHSQRVIFSLMLHLWDLESVYCMRQLILDARMADSGSQS